MHVLYSVSLTAHIHAPGTAAEGGRGDAADASAGDGGETACGAATRQTGKKKWNWKRCWEAKTWSTLDGWVGTLLYVNSFGY